MSQQIYLNHGATSLRKPEPVMAAVTTYLQQNQELAAKRSFMGDASERNRYLAREAVAEFFNYPDASHVIFTANVTTSLNMILQGCLRPGDHVLTTSVEHNAVSRPLAMLQKQGVEVTYLPCGVDGSLDPQLVADSIRPNTRLLVMTHASNVLGTILPIKECFAIAKAHGVLTVLDTAQTAGFLPIDMLDLQADVVAFTGHKGLLALAGIGGFILNDEAAAVMRPWLTGGTGSFSELADMPTVLPDRFEPGTPNELGICSLRASLAWLEAQDYLALAQQERELTQQFLAGIKELPLRILGRQNIQESVPVVSVVPQQMSCDELALQLFEDYGIITRNGLHCAPWAHETAGTLATGTVRFSFGWDTTSWEIQQAVQALTEILTKE
ncbi:selenocysteine lyase SclA [Enterococcus diestrammenae]|uniref:selenocysteine lyase SclA n=1 Tax=Enterococcus diestrammenae TaxID=1155073 RepID=UPI0022E98A5A|nr:selenocysteine lyase SclA [Enterococcus diestrammenae]